MKGKNKTVSSLLRKASNPVKYPEILVPGEPLRAADILQPYGKYFKSPLIRWEAIKSGLKTEAITDLLEITGAKQNEVSGWLSITEPTLRKYIQAKKPLNLVLSEHIIQLFELFDKGLDTFGSVAEFKSWLKHFNIGIDAVPSDMLDTITGITIVMHELTRIDYGATE